MASAPEFQHTLSRSAGFSGTSLHTGEKVSLKLHPAPADHGIKFRRKDLPDEPTIDAKIDNLKMVERATTIGEGSMRVHTVEHVLAALSAMGVDNVIVEMDANEPPIGDGSAKAYVDVIKRAGVSAQEAPRKFFHVREPMHIETKTGAMLVLLPDNNGLRISCTQAGPNNRFTQFMSTDIVPELFEREIAPARTFVYYEEVESLMEKNLIKGGSLENAVVVRGDAVLSKEPLRFQDEFVRHKILDIVGDLALVGCRIRGHLIAVKPGHAANAELARAIAKEQSRRDTLAVPRVVPKGNGGLDSEEIMQILPHRYPFLMVDRIHQLRRKRNEMHRRQIGHDQRAVFPGTFSGPSGDAGCDAGGSYGAGREFVAVQACENDQPDRLFHERGRREVSQAGDAGRHDVHSR